MPRLMGPHELAGYVWNNVRIILIEPESVDKEFRYDGAQPIQFIGRLEVDPSSLRSRFSHALLRLASPRFHEGDLVRVNATNMPSGHPPKIRFRHLPPTDQLAWAAAEPWKIPTTRGASWQTYVAQKAKKNRGHAGRRIYGYFYWWYPSRGAVGNPRVEFIGFDEAKVAQIRPHLPAAMRAIEQRVGRRVNFPSPVRSMTKAQIQRGRRVRGPGHEGGGGHGEFDTYSGIVSINASMEPLNILANFIHENIHAACPSLHEVEVDQMTEEILVELGLVRGRRRRSRQNPAPDVYDPGAEQLRAQKQAIYESCVLRETGKRSFRSIKTGRRADLSLPAEKRNYLIKRCMFIMGTGVARRDKRVKRGTQTPTAKAVAESRKRYVDVDKLIRNRQDYEETLGFARKGGFYRMTIEPTRDGLAYFVWPMPPGERTPIRFDRQSDAKKAAAMLNKADPRRTGKFWSPPTRAYTPRDLDYWLPPASAFRRK